ncbi:DUF1152 domain-containing protein [Pedosphaera parvula]|uniref:DUF1152 domain-containing protein n=1 Tax=Pedosphaera parvula (strain Ellin514) TaxID=320771 RepID=B9XNB2_PEDPL|nr:DUF1152 domain-containing protein [Pedosphaera parvula]EEF58665.1 conserved hypothetical protein [Pedosphaera parvula Ellin514]
MKLAFFNEIEKAQNVLIVGAGGGFDIFSGLPLYFALRKAGKTVHLANLSFSRIDFCEGERPIPSLLKVTPGTSGPASYFPEVYLSQWLSNRFGETPIYAISQAGARPVQEAYNWLVQTLRPDTLILTDGGTDSLMRGDEASLGTPEEDMASLSAAHCVEGPERKLLVCLGFGIDFFHGICHAHFLENVAALIAEGGYLGTWSVTREMEEFGLYEEACEFVSARMPRQPSIVNSSIISAINGNFGDFHSTKRTAGSTLFINPLMGLYWSFRLENVARRNLYLNDIRDTVAYHELSLAIEKFRAMQQKTRLWTDIPC